MKKHNLQGQRFGRLVVGGPAPSLAARTRWHVRCDCGTETVVATELLRSGRTTSCGCRLRETHQAIGALNRTHGMSGTPLHSVWEQLVQRCTNPRHKDFANYGGRGITVCERWRGAHGFESFLADITAEIGERPPKHSIDRIDNDRGYEPGNVRWATQKQQCANTRHTAPITAFGRTMLADEWSAETGVSVSTIHRRIREGWPPEQAVKEPPASGGQLRAGLADILRSAEPGDSTDSAGRLRARP